MSFSITEGYDREKIDKLVPELREKWANMTQEEKIEETKDALEELDSRHENKKLAVHNMPISCFHDARTNLDSVETTVRHSHTPECNLLTLFPAAYRSIRPYRRGIHIDLSARI